MPVSAPQIGPSSAAALNASTGAYGATTSSLTDYLKKNGLATDSGSINTLWNGAFGTTGTKYTGSAPQNAALLHAVQTGYKSTVNSKTISGSPSVQQSMNTTSAMNGAGASIGGTTTPSTTPPPPPITPTTPITATDPNVAQMQTTTQTALTQAKQDAAVALQPVTDTYNTNLQLLQNQKSDAVAAAKATYAAANPNGFGSDQDEYIASISSAYDSQIQNLQNSYTDAVAQNSQSYQDNVNTINSTYQQNLMTYQQNQQANLQQMLTDYPPTPISGSSDPNTAAGASNLMQWAQDNPELMQTAFSTGQYGEMTNPDGSINYGAIISAAAQLSAPSAAYIKEQTSEETANADVTKAGAAVESAGAAVENAGTNAGKLELDKNVAGAPEISTSSTPGFFTTSTTTKTTQKNLGVMSNGVDLSQF